MSYWKCIKTVITDGGNQAFTEGQLYQGKPWYKENEKGDDTEEAGVSFRNNQGNLHFGPFRWLHVHFIEVATKAERDELWQPGDEPYEPDYWGVHYE